MASTSKNLNTKKRKARDRLSELPDEILVHILSKLPILDAVRTVLLRRFGNLWTSVPFLSFVDKQIVSSKWSGRKIDTLTRFARFVRNVLILHKTTPLDRFRLRFDQYDCDNGLLESEVTTWIRFAIDKQVKQLEVDFVNDTESHFVPRCIFTSQFLVELKLDMCTIPQLSRVQMMSLRKLSLTYVDTHIKFFDRLISGAPSLQELVLSCVYGIPELRFTAPNINKLDVCVCNSLLDCPNLKILNILTCDPDHNHLFMLDTSSVCEVNIGTCCIVGDFVEYVKKFFDARVFKYSDEYFEEAGFSEIKEVDFPQTRWKSLHITSCLHDHALVAISKVVSSSSCLEELIIYVHCYRGETLDRNVLSLECTPLCTSQQLKTVTVCGYLGPCQSILQLAEFFLKSSVTLEKMVIMPSEDHVESLEDFKFVKQLLSFSRVSPNARVIFGSETY